MLNRSGVTLKRVLEDLGSTVLGTSALPGETGSEVTGVHIYDPLDELQVPPGGLLLGVGVEGEPPICALLDALAESGAAGLVVKSPSRVWVPSAAVRAKVIESGVALLGLTRAASWAQIAALLRSLLSEGDVGSAGGEAHGDLFAIANAVCELLDAPVTIEDRSSRVLAFSVRQEEADQFRVETVLGRQVPERFIRMYEEMGFFRRLYQSREPLYLEMDGMLTRVAVAVRAGDEILGSIWAAVRAPLSDQRMRAFADAAKIVALHLLRERGGLDAQRRLRADLLSTLLEGGGQAAEAAERLDLAGQRVCVLAAQLRQPEAHEPGAVAELDAARGESERQRFADALGLHVAAIHPRAATALIGGVAYAVLPLHGMAGIGTCSPRAVQVAEDFLARLSGRYAANIGVGRLAGSTAEIARSRDDADRALRVLRARHTPGTVAAFTDVHFESLLLQLRDLVAAQNQPPTGPYERLVAYDREHGSDLVPTLAAYLEAFGNVNEAAAVVRVHANTFRYRLRRLTEISGLDLADPGARLAVMLQLRLFHPGEFGHPDDSKV